MNEENREITETNEEKDSAINIEPQENTDEVSSPEESEETPSLGEITSEEVVEEIIEETMSAINEEDDHQIISEFAPAPINIPRYNKEKEQKKAEKEKIKRRKRRSKKSKRRRRILRRVVSCIRNIFLFILLLCVLTASFASLFVKMNTNDTAVEKAIENSSPERYIVGKIEDYEKLNLKESAQKASVADILRDNAIFAITYDDIEKAVMNSSYPEFVAKRTRAVLDYYIYGAEYKEVSGEDISEILLENSSHIRPVTGIELGESACDEFGAYFEKSDAYKDISLSNVNKQQAAEYTYITAVMFSTSILVGLLIAAVLLLILIVIACRGFAHKMIAWTIILAGIIVSALAYLYTPAFSAKSQFVKCVLKAFEKSIDKNALIFGGVTILAGLIIMLIGQAMSDDYEYEDEDDYIDEIEQVSTAQ